MIARFILTIDDFETGEVAEVPEDTLSYLEGVIEDAVEQDKRIQRAIFEDTGLGDGREVTVSLLG